jgi:hypothetical protein
MAWQKRQPMPSRSGATTPTGARISMEPGEWQARQVRATSLPSSAIASARAAWNTGSTNEPACTEVLHTS